MLKASFSSIDSSAFSLSLSFSLSPYLPFGPILGARLVARMGKTFFQTAGSIFRTSLRQKHDQGRSLLCISRKRVIVFPPLILPMLPFKLIHFFFIFERLRNPLQQTGHSLARERHSILGVGGRACKSCKAVDLIGRQAR